MLRSATCRAGRRDGIGAQYGVAEERRFARAEELFAAGGLDAVAILTTGSHAALAAAAAAQGLAVFCEKPLAYSAGEVDELASTDPVLQLGYMKLYDPAVERAAAALAERPAPRSIEVTVLHPPTGPQLAHANLLPSVADIGSDDLARLAGGRSDRARPSAGRGAEVARSICTPTSSWAASSTTWP